MIRIGNSSFKFEHSFLFSKAVVTGPLEQSGPIGDYFDYSFDDIHCNEDNWEKAEMALVKKAYEIALSRGNIQESDLSFIFGGDLNNQIAITSYAMRDCMVPYLGTFAACSTFTENLFLASVLIENMIGGYIMCLTSSHNATSERQFRYPTEYGGQKPLSMTFTATASGAVIISNTKTDIRIAGGTVGTIIDIGLKDAQDMGRTMAPAAVITLLSHLSDFNRTIADYDLIVTGDLSTYGSDIFEKCCLEHGIDLKEKHIDAGITLYDTEKQNVFAGGSGCGCVTAVSLGYLVEKLKQGTYKRILILATGALMNPIMTAQKESIPCISHGIILERCDNYELY